MGVKLLRGPERVSPPLDQKNRFSHLGQVVDSKLFWFARRMERIAERHQPSDLQPLGHGHRRSPATHGTPADDDALGVDRPGVGRSSYRLLHRCDQLRHSIWRPPSRPLLSVRKIDSSHRQSKPILKFGFDPQKETMVSVATGTVEQDQARWLERTTTSGH